MQEYIDQLKAEGWIAAIKYGNRIAIMQRGNKLAKVTQAGVVYRSVSDYRDSKPKETKQERINW